MVASAFTSSAGSLRLRRNSDLCAFIGPSKPPPTSPTRPVTVAKVVQKDVPRYLDEIGTCAAYETVQVQAQVNG